MFLVDHTLPDCTVKVAALDPAATVTLAGTVATDVLLLERLICIPPAGAGLLSVTVPCDVPPDLIVLGLRLSDDNTGPVTVGVTDAGCTVSTAETMAPEYAALS
jgi:hypothetical protein